MGLLHSQKELDSPSLDSLPLNAVGIFFKLSYRIGCNITIHAKTVNLPLIFLFIDLFYS